MPWTPNSRVRKGALSNFDRPVIVSLSQPRPNIKLRGSTSTRATKRRAKFQGPLPEIDLGASIGEKNDVDASHSDARLIEKRIRTLDEDEALARYHELIDKRLINDLDYKEVFELELIEARLNAADEADLQQVKTLENAWAQEQKTLIDSVQQLLSRLAAA